MKLFDKIRRRKYFRYDLFVNNGDGWHKFGDYKEFLDYKDIESPDPGSVLKLYGVYNDSSRREGYARESLWEHEVPVPGGKSAAGGGKKEKPIEERLMEKIIEGADFSNLKPHKMSVPLGKSGGSLEFESPVNVPIGDGSGGGYVVIDGNRYPMGDVPPLEFEGKLPAWLHPAAGAMITSFMDRAGGFIKGAIGSAITETTGIKAKNPPASQIAQNAESIEKPKDAVDELDALLDEGDKESSDKIKNSEDVK